jgi:hypothetical protein
MNIIIIFRAKADLKSIRSKNRRWLVISKANTSHFGKSQYGRTIMAEKNRCENQKGKTKNQIGKTR